MEYDTPRTVVDEPPTDGEPTIAADSATLLPLAVLETVLSRTGSWGVTEIAQVLGLPKARVHRHLPICAPPGICRRTPRVGGMSPAGGWSCWASGSRRPRRWSDWPVR